MENPQSVIFPERTEPWARLVVDADLENTQSDIFQRNIIEHAPTVWARHLVTADF